jgi:hypothetical protein
MSAEEFVDYLVGRLKDAGIDDAELVRANYDSKSFGNAEAVFRARPLVLRFLRDRGEEFLELATNAAPEQFYQFGDVEIAMRWKTVDEILARRELEGLDRILDRLRQHRAELNDAFSGDRERLTRARLEQAMQKRGDAFMDRLRGKK